MSAENQLKIASDEPVDIGLPVSWNIGSGPYYWYRVESLCQQIDCENTGIGYDGCPIMTIITTVAARNVDELCTLLASPLTRAPLAAKVTSIKRYSRPVFRAEIPDGQCNNLDDVEFCHIPACLDYCPEVLLAPAVPKRHKRPTRRVAARRSNPNSDSVSAMSDFDFGTYVEFFPLSTEYEEEMLAESGEVLEGESVAVSPPTPGIFLSGSAEVSCTFLAHQSYGFIVVSGDSYLVSPSGSFRPSGHISIYGSARATNLIPTGGSIVVTGSAVASALAYGSSSGSISLSGRSINESPSYTYSASGSISVAGEIQTFFNNVGTFFVPFQTSLTAFGFGFEYLEETGESLLTISDFSVDACGCFGIGSTMSVRHNLMQSEAFARFVESSGLSYPSVSTLRYRAADSSWSSVDHLAGRYESWRVSQTFQCQDDQWRLSLGIDGENKKTRLALDIPSDLICMEGFVQSSVAAYFSPYSSLDGKGVKIDAVSPRKPRRSKVSGDVEVFVNGIFVTHTVYYDELGIFKDSYWYGAPFEMDMNPVAKNTATVMDVSWVS